MVVSGVGSNEVPKVQAVEMKLAHAKLRKVSSFKTAIKHWFEGKLYLIPVVTATCPNRLNQPVIHDAIAAFSFLDSIAAQK